MKYQLNGLIAATYTPMGDAGQLCLSAVRPLVDALILERVDGLYVCGSTGEGMSLTGSERRAVAEAFVRAADGRVPVVIQVGHNSITEAAQLAAHAQHVGADAVSATAPSYFKVGTVELLLDSMAQIAAAAAELPFYYYHIPALTGADVDMVAFLQLAGRRMANLSGIKYTCPTVHEFQACREVDAGRFDILWGCDEMLLSALAAGASGAVGSTYNVAAGLYRKILEAFSAGDLDEARRLQGLSVKMVRTIAAFPFHPAMKEIMKMLDRDCGPCRLPHPRLSQSQVADLRRDLDEIGFFEWRRP